MDCSSPSFPVFHHLPEFAQIYVMNSTCIKKVWLLFKKKTENSEQKIGKFVHCWWECEAIQLMWKLLCQLLKKLKIQFQDDPANPISGYIHKSESKILERCFYIHVHTSSIHNSYNMEANHESLTDEWKGRMWYLHTMECYLALERKELLQYVTTWSQSQKDK